MKIILLGGGTGGHFYPLIAVAQALRKISEEERIVALELTLMGNRPFDVRALREEEINFQIIAAGKVRRYFSLRNFSDSVKTLHGILQSIWKFTLSPPDIVFSKGGYDSFPALVASRFYKIPVIIHESDSVPGKVNAWAAKFAVRIAISFPETAAYFPQEKVALTGQPIRHGLLGGLEGEALDMFDLETGIPTILILGGSQGAQPINDVVIEALPNLLEHVQIIHSTGKENIQSVKAEAAVVLEKNENKKRYHPYPFLTQSQLRNASFISELVLARAGSGTIFEIAAWHLPALLVPLPHAAQDHQRENAYNYARTGAADVIEESNLTPHLLAAEILHIINSKEKKEEMKKAANAFARIDAAEKIAREILSLGLHD